MGKHPPNRLAGPAFRAGRKERKSRVGCQKAEELSTYVARRSHDDGLDHRAHDETQLVPFQLNGLEKDFDSAADWFDEGFAVIWRTKLERHSARGGRRASPRASLRR